MRRPPRSSRCADWPNSVAAACGSVSGCTPSAATRRRRRGQSPTNYWPISARTRSAKPLSCMLSRESEGQRRMTALHGGRVDQLEIYPNLWAGVGLVRGGAGTALVGSHEEVANLVYEYHSVGFDEFILSGYPHLEEAYWFAEGVLPLLRHK